MHGRERRERASPVPAAPPAAARAARKPGAPRQADPTSSGGSRGHPEPERASGPQSSGSPTRHVPAEACGSRRMSRCSLSLEPTSRSRVSLPGPVPAVGSGVRFPMDPGGQGRKAREPRGRTAAGRRVLQRPHTQRRAGPAAPRIRPDGNASPLVTPAGLPRLPATQWANAVVGRTRTR